jgi:hypothetical protein
VVGVLRLRVLRLRLRPVLPTLTLLLSRVQHRTIGPKRRVAKQPKTTFQVRVVEKVEKAKVPEVEVAQEKAQAREAVKAQEKAQEKAQARVRATVRARVPVKVPEKAPEKAPARGQEREVEKVQERVQAKGAKNVQKPPKQPTLP